jgi:hypothetical protein
MHEQAQRLAASVGVFRLGVPAHVVASTRPRPALARA